MSAGAPKRRIILGRMAYYAVVLATVVLAGCASQPGPAPPRQHEKLNAVLWSQTAVEHDAVVRQSFQLARIQVEKALADKTWTAAVEQEGDFARLPPAVILDADETVLDNSISEGRAISRNLNFDEKLWREWINEARATALPGAAGFIRYLHEKKIAVFFITNRLAEEEAATRRNLQAVGFPVEESFDNVLCNGEKPEWTSDKTTRRRAVAASHRILLLLGDDFNDFVSGVRTGLEERRKVDAQHSERWGTRWIMLPNPMYGSWEAAAYGAKRGLSEAERLAAKHAALKK